MKRRGAKREGGKGRKVDGMEESTFGGRTTKGMIRCTVQTDVPPYPFLTLLSHSPYLLHGTLVLVSLYLNHITLTTSYSVTET